MRVTEQEVKAIISTPLTTGEINPFLQSANILVTDVLGSTDMSTARLADIEKWLAAHFVAIRTPQATERSIGPAKEVYGRITAGSGLNATRFGQQVLMLDTSGRLASLGTRKGIASATSHKWQDAPDATTTT